MQPPTQKPKGQLRDSFIFFFILISCIPLLLLGVVSLITISNSHKKNVSELEYQSLVRASEETTTFFTTVTDTLSTNFDTLDASTLSKSATTWQETYAQKFLDDNKAFLEVSFISPEGKEVAKSSRINKTPPLLYYSEYPLFQRALKGEVVMSDVHTTLKGQSITILVPSRINGTVVNVVMAEVDLTPLINSLNTIHVGNTGYVLLFDKEGTLIGSDHAGDATLDVNFLTWDRFLKVAQGSSFDSLSLNDRYVSLVSNTPVVSSALRISKLDWPLIVEWPTLESDSLIESFRNKILGSIFFSIILVLILAPFLVSRLVRPIKQLEKLTKEIENGNFDKQAEITTNDELEELGDSFNSMAIGLKRLEELKNEFVYIAAHELRSPVTAIKGYLELIFDGTAGALTPELEHFLSTIRTSNNRLVNLVNDLLKVARSEAGKLEIAVSPVDIRPEIRAILEEVKPLALKRNIIITYNPEENLPLVQVNTGSFKEVIMNFVSNSIKYGNDNGTLTLSHKLEGNMLKTYLADNGRGISEDDQKHLFEKFFRAGDVKKTEIEGTGLGLFITKELIEKMDGTISVTSTLGVGTTFVVSFKIAENLTPLTHPIAS